MKHTVILGAARTAFDQTTSPVSGAENPPRRGGGMDPVVICSGEGQGAAMLQEV